MICQECKKEVACVTQRDEYLFIATRTCLWCRDKAYEESYRIQDSIACCRNCNAVDQDDDWLLCGHGGQPVSSVGICSLFVAAPPVTDVREGGHEKTES